MTEREGGTEIEKRKEREAKRINKESEAKRFDKGSARGRERKKANEERGSSERWDVYVCVCGGGGGGDRRG